MLESPTRDEVVARAVSYPYSPPDTSYVWVANHHVELVELDPDRLADTKIRPDDESVLSLGRYCDQIGIGARSLEETRTPVLAYGSNASIEALGRKLIGSPETSVVPVARALLHDLDVVYSAHFSPYGAIGAALQSSPGTVVSTFVVFVTNALLEALHATEPNYDYRQLLNVSKHGCLVLDGDNVALAARAAENRRLPELLERDVLERAWRQLAPGVEFETFVYENATDRDLARKRTATLRETARPLDWPTADPAPVSAG